MKRSFLLLLLVGCGLSLSMMTGCRRSVDDMYRDTCSQGRHANRSLFGKQKESRQIKNAADFSGGYEDDFVSIDPEGTAQRLRSSDVLPPPDETPGEKGSSIPSIDAFQDPRNNKQLAQIFKNVPFGYNSSLIKTSEAIDTLRSIATYMKNNQPISIFIEGHCDERGPAAYNFALGANRANSVRSFLAKEGVSLNDMFTISYGKERPLVAGNNEEAWKVNRRAQFRIFKK